MKKTAIPLIAFAFLLFSASCNNGNKENDTTGKDTISAPVGTSAVTSETSTFDINTIPVSEKELGAFPFFSLPHNLVSQNKPITRSFDRIFFPVDGVMMPIEGKVWKSYIVKADNSPEDWSLPYFERSYDEIIREAGGVKIFDAKVSQQELDRIEEQAQYFGEEGSLDYWNEPVKVYLIRRPNGEDIYIQLSGNTAGGAIQVLQKAPFKQTITMLPSDEILKQLNEKGKAVLHINFDTDKAVLKPEGTDAVKEIIKALNAQKDLNIAINGYTDNAGNAEHNLKLSEARTEAVKKEIIKAGISESRLSSKGFGQEQPVADNNTEEGKAQNRRVELVKQ